MHEETWAGLLQKQGLKISQEVETIPGCAVAVACPSSPDNSLVSPGPGRVILDMLGWALMEKTEGSGVWLFRVALKGRISFSSLYASGDWQKKGSFVTAWAVLPLSSCSCSCAYGQTTAVGPQTGEWCWPLLAGVWRAIALLMKPWCAEEEVPTAANLNLYREWRSCVGWHRDDLPRFGECGEAKPVVSVSFGSSAVFKWRRQSRPDDEGHLCWLRHGDVLVMDGQCQDEFLHCTDCGLDQERINITFRWIKHVASCVLLANVCAGFIRPCDGVGGERRVLGILGAPGDSVCMMVLALLVYHLMSTGSGETRTPFGRRSVGAFSA